MATDGIPESGAPFQVPAADPDRWFASGLSRVLRPLAQRIIGFSRINRHYRDIVRVDDGRSFADRVLDNWGVSLSLTDEEIARIPEKGPVMVVANHPSGILEGLMLISILGRARPDSRVMTNTFLRMIPDLEESCFFVDPMATEESTRNNLRSMKTSMRWLTAGHALGVFPAGEVAHLRLSQRAIVETRWSDTIARMARRAKATVVPLYFGGFNGPLFHLAGLIHPRLRTYLIPREFLARRGRVVEARIGKAIPWRQLEELGSDAERIAYLQERTRFLGTKRKKDPTGGLSLPGRRKKTEEPKAMVPVASPADPERLRSELEALPAEQCLARQGDFRVYLAQADDVPTVMDEIGRLREITFRNVGEGTGRARDIDRYDAHYQHLILWNAAEREVAGGYRLGVVREVVERHGIEGLYTASLFHFQQGLLERLESAIELGRSFVTDRYQRSYTALFMLWKGIGAFLVDRPGLHQLFGPVSLSADYPVQARQLLVRFLKSYFYETDLARFVRPRNSPGRGLGGWQSSPPSALSAINSIIADVDPAGRGIPILYRQYLNFGARAIGFNIDPEFGDCLDTLMLVDLAESDRRIVSRLIGPEQAEILFAHWSRQSSRVTA